MFTLKSGKLFFLILCAFFIPILSQAEEAAEGLDHEPELIIQQKEKAIELEFSNAILPDTLNSQARLIILKKYDQLDCLQFTLLHEIACNVE